MLNFWPDESKAELTPLYVLNELSQVRHLNGRVWAHVAHKDNQATVMLKGQGEGVHLLNIDNAKGYPCKLWYDGKCSKVRTSAELIGKLAWAFNHAKTRQVIAELMKGGGK